MDTFLDNGYADYPPISNNPQDPLQPPSFMMQHLDDSPDAMPPHPHQHQHCGGHWPDHSSTSPAFEHQHSHHQHSHHQQQQQQQHQQQQQQQQHHHQQQRHQQQHAPHRNQYQQHHQPSHPHPHESRLISHSDAHTASAAVGKVEDMNTPHQAFYPQQQQHQQQQQQQHQHQHQQPQQHQNPHSRPQFFDYQPSVSDMSSRPQSSDENWQYTVSMPPAQAFAQESQAQYAPYVPHQQPQQAILLDFSNGTPQPGSANMVAAPSNMAIVPANRNSFGAASHSSVESYGPLQNFQHDLNSNLANYVQQQMSQANFAPPATFSVSPQETTIESFSASSPSDSGWQIVDLSRMSSRPSNESLFEVYQPMNGTEPMQTVPADASIANPGLTLHIRTGSNETCSNHADHESSGSQASFGSFDNVDMHSWDTSSPEATYDHYSRHVVKARDASSPTDSAGSTSPKSPASAGSFNSRKRKTLELAPAPGIKAAAKKGPLSQRKDAGGIEKKVGKRKGPLRPDQRRQAGEIRKMRACLRCRFLKKTCDTGDPCQGCQPSHARLWQVPCTRIDIRDLHYFVKAFRDVDFSRHVKPGSSALNIVSFGDRETPMYITHGFGFVLPIQAREIVVRDPDAFKADWVETLHEKPVEFEVETMALTVSANGLGPEMAQQYLDEHIKSGWDHFVDKQFQGTPFWTEMLKTVHKFWLKTKQPILKAALEMVLAYNLTQHICWAEGFDESHDGSQPPGKVVDPESCYRGKTAAPVFINFHVKSVFAKIWRDAQRTVLEKLSELWSSFYTGEKAKNWPIILMAASMLLLMWEEMEFDANYRMEDQEAVRKFRTELSSTPVGVIVGLFSAMCQKYPQFSEWDSEKHGHVVNGDATVCAMLEEVRGHILNYSNYLEERPQAKFNRDDFDSLCNKYLARLILRKQPA